MRPETHADVFLSYSYFLANIFLAVQKHLQMSSSATGSGAKECAAKATLK